MATRLREVKMAKGYCNITFSGGPLDGETDEIRSQLLVNEMIFDPGFFFVENKDKTVTRTEGKRLPSINWVYYNVDVYTQKAKQVDTYIYEHIGIRQINRCLASTQKGTRCGHPASQKNDYCKTHQKMTK